MSITIEALTRLHDRKYLDCGVTELNQFLQNQARQKNDKHIAKTYVVHSESELSLILGYYTITGYSVIIPPAHRNYKNYPHPLKAVKLARLAVDKSQQGQRLGERLLINAIFRTVLVAEQISAIGLFVDPMNSQIIPFYEQYGFLHLEQGGAGGLEMWLPIKTCQKLVDSMGT